MLTGIYARGVVFIETDKKLNKPSALTAMYQCRCPGLIFYYDYKISPPGELAKGHMSLLMAKESPTHV